MSLITIPGMTQDALLNTSTAPTGGSGLRPFPCDGFGFIKQTGVVLKCEIKSFKEGEDTLSILIGNGQYGGEVLINLDPSLTGPGCKDVAKQQQNNLETLVKAISLLGAHTNEKLDTAKLEKAHGMAVQISVKHNGFREKDGKHYHKISIYLDGAVPEMLPVIEVPSMPTLPGQQAQQAPQAFAGDPLAGW